MKRENNLQIIRFLLAFLVFIMHFVGLSGLKEVSFVKNFHYAVYVFFIISGMLVYASVERNDLFTYGKNRLLRILPAYYFVVIFFSLLLFFSSSKNILEYFSYEYFSYLFVNLIFLNFLKPCIHDVFSMNPIDCSVNGSLWTIKVEVMFYLFVPFLYKFIKNKTKQIQNLILIILYLLSFAYFYYFNIVKDNYLFAKQFPGALMYFVSGILLYKNFDFFKKYSIYFILPSFYFIYDYTAIFFPISFAIILFVVSFQLPYIKFLDFKNDVSYGIYLIHYPVIQFLVSYELHKLPTLAYSIIVFFVVLLLSIITWKYIEKPALSLQIFRRRNK